MIENIRFVISKDEYSSNYIGQYKFDIVDNGIEVIDKTVDIILEYDQVVEFEKFVNHDIDSLEYEIDPHYLSSSVQTQVLKCSRDPYYNVPIIEIYQVNISNKPHNVFDPNIYRYVYFPLTDQQIQIHK